jgi:RyR domain
MSGQPQGTCAAVGCSLRVNHGMVFCVSHWNALPRELRDGIYASQRKPDKYAGARASAVAWLAKASLSNKRTTELPQVKLDTDDIVERVAAIAHEANRAYCRGIGDNSQLAWDDAPPWQRQSAIRGVRYAVSHPDSTPASIHESWLAEKRADGWIYGKNKDPMAKTHPCFVPYDMLPAEQKVKDYIFQAVVVTAVAQFRSV